MDGLSELRKYMSSHVAGKNVDGVLYAFGKAYEILQQTSVAVTDQLTISTATGKYLDLRLGDKGVVRPADLGMSDFSFRQLGITITATKQVREVLHEVMEVFYGADAVRGFTVAGNPEPYNLEDCDLTLRFEDGADKVVVFREEQFGNIQQATAQETVNALNAYLRELGINTFASIATNFDTGEKFVKIYGAAKGPYSLVQVFGGKAQVQFEFPTIRDTVLPSNTTVWQITKNGETNIRFRWDSGPEPKLEDIFIGDRALIYGAPFLNADSDLVGTFTVTNVRPTQGIPSFDTGWFEIEAQVPDLRNSTPNVAPPPNTLSDTYSYTINQVVNDDVKFYLARKNVPYAQTRYALAFEPAPALLRVYLPATTNIIERQLVGGAHLHFLYQSTEFNGAHGHATDAALQIEIMNDYTVRYVQNKSDNEGQGGIMTYGITTKDVERVYRESGYTYIITTEPHDLVGYNQWLPTDDYLVDDEKIYFGRAWRATDNSGPSYGGPRVPMTASLFWQDIGAGVNLTDTVIDLTVEDVQSDPDEGFNGPYTWDTQGTYTLASVVGVTRDVIHEGEQKSLLSVNGAFPDQESYVLFDLNKDTQEGPVKYLVSQQQVSDTIVNIQSISRIGTLVTVITETPHNALVGSLVVISGTINFNGSYLITEIPDSNVYNFQTLALGDVVESVGTSTTVIDSDVSILTIDPSYRFMFRHDLESSVSLLSANVTYTPSIDGKDFSFYATGTADARIFCQEIIQKIVALGINLEIVIIYPDDAGLGNAGEGTDLAQVPPISEAATFVWASSRSG